ILICRTDREIPAEMRQKIAMFCNVDPGGVFWSPDVKSIYELPLELHRQGLDERLSEVLNIWSRAPRLERWERILEKVYSPAKGEVRIGIVGKYTDLKESYKSLNEALMHGGIANDVRVTLKYVDSQDVESQGAPRRRGRGAGARRIRGARDRGEGDGGPLRPRAEGPLLRHLPRTPDGGGGVRPGRARAGWRQLGRVRREDSPPGHLAPRVAGP